jgi:DNA-3-methyladenine glycosylase II
MENTLVASTTFRLEPVPPYRLDLTVWVLKRRPDYVVDDWDGETYRRTLLIDGNPVQIAVCQPDAPDDAPLEVSLCGSEVAIAQSGRILQVIARLLGTAVDLSGYYSFAYEDELLGPLVRRFAGFKPTRYPTLFECLTNAIACQQLTLTFGLQVVSRLVERYGVPLETDQGLTHAFPSPAEIMHADPDVLREIGFSRQKARALIELADGLQSGEIDFSAMETLDDETAIRQLVALRGVGRWTAEYTLLRGLGRLHVFPGDDVGARNTLRTWTGAAEPLTYDAVRATLARWKQYAGLLYFQMLLLGLESKGRVKVDPL